jgi:amiloride-sensitive sodium channel
MIGRLMKLEALAQICPQIYKKLPTDIESDPKLYAKTLKKIYMSAQNYGQISWNGVNLKDSSYTADILTDFGYCTTFNMIDLNYIYNTKELDEEYLEDFQNQYFWSDDRKPDHWDIGSGYSRNAHFKTYPIRSFESDERLGFKMILKLFKQDLGLPCTKLNSGYKIVVHHPAELPIISKNYIQASFDQKSTLVVRAEIVKTSDDLLGYSSEKRQCYLPGEYHLKFFKIYTKQNCEIECLTNFTLQTCGCVSLNMPRGKDSKVCGFADLQCVEIARHSLFIAKMSAKYKDHDMCTCLNPCFHVTYQADIVKSRIDDDMDFDQERYNSLKWPLSLI